MTAPAPDTAEYTETPPTDHDIAFEAAVGILAVYLASKAAIGAAALPADLVAALVRLGIPEHAVRHAGRLGLSVPITGRTRTGSPRPGAKPTARRMVAADEPAFRARYIAAAAQRLADGAANGKLAEALHREQGYLARHRTAGIRRRAAAARYDAAAARSRNGLMVWQTRQDDRVTPDCARLQGRVFHRDHPPGGRMPGVQHPECRCWARPLSPIPAPRTGR